MYSILSECPLFRGMPEDKIKEILEDNCNYTIAKYAKGDLIAKQDTAYYGLMIILKGRVYGEVLYSSGKRTRIEVAEAPNLIAPAFLFGGYNKLPVDIIADSDVEILTLHRGYLFELMQNNALILSNFIDIISDTANFWTKRIYYLSFRSLKEKIVVYLLEHSAENNPKVPVSDLTELSQYFDVTRTAVQVVLSELEKKKLIKSDANSITVLNRKFLSDSIK